MIKAILFDCFGVVYTDSFSIVYEKFGGNLEKDYDFIHETFHASNSGRIPTATPFFAKKLQISEAEWDDVMRSTGSENTELLDFIKTLKNDYKIGMLSNVGSGGLLRYFKKETLDDHFDVVVESSKIGFAKPEARAYEITADKLGVRLDECVFIDDRPEYVEGAQHVGMKTILYTDFQSFKKELENVLG